MSRNSKQRRDARKKKQGARGPSEPRFGGSPGSGGGPFGFSDARAGAEDFWRQPPPSSHEAELFRAMDDALRSGFGRDRDATAFARAVARIVGLSDMIPWQRTERLLGEQLDVELSAVFDGGWQPAEIVHLATRDLGGVEVRLLTILIGSHAVSRSAFEKAPTAWVEQLTELGLTPAAERGVSALRHWMRTEQLTRAQVWEPALKLFSRLANTADLPALLPLPGDWQRGGSTPLDNRTDAKILGRIRGLLAKAEASEFAEEAETLSAKAQDLMTRYAIETAMLDAQARTDLTAEVRTRRLLVGNPYPEAKLSLLNAVAESNSARVIWHKDAALASIVGLPVDLDLCELLFTSLLVQSSHALRDAGTDRGTRTPSFRRSFLISYASRIGERLAEARDRAAAAAAGGYGRSLVPVLNARDEAVGSVFDELFPQVVSIHQSATNGAGWARGRQAAEAADLTGGREPIGDRGALT